MEDQLVQKAMTALYAAASKADQDLTRPMFHYRPPAQWMNDVCGSKGTQRGNPGGDTMDHIALTTDKRVLHPVRDENDTARVTLTAFYSDGSQCVLPVSEAVVTARTKHASGDVQVVKIEG